MKANVSGLAKATGLWAVWILASTWTAPALPADCSRSLESMVRLAAGRIDGVLRDVAASTRALGEESGRLLARSFPASDADKATWESRATTRGSTTGFRTWPDGSPTPAFQAPFPGIYSYGGECLTDDKAARLQAFERLVPIFRAAYRSFDLSWVYLTTADDMMLIYPYVPIAEAVNNGTPTATPFYEAAVSRFDWVNEVTEQVLATAAQSGTTDAITPAVDGRQVQAARIDSTGWLVVLVTGKA